MIMKTTLVLLGFISALAQALLSVPERAGLHHFEKKPVHFGVKSLQKRETEPGNKHDCQPTPACITGGGYCIESKQKEDCNGIFLPNECKMAHCSCCIENKCNSNPCGPNSRCVSTPGSYQCVCNSGYEKVNGACVDINECLSNVCTANAACTNTPGSYECQCLPGFTLENGICGDINECNWDNITCQVDEKCDNTQGSYTCTKKCQADSVYMPNEDHCAKIISGNMTFGQGNAACIQNSMAMAVLDSFDLVLDYSDAFLPNVGDSAWVAAVGSVVVDGDNCPVLLKIAGDFQFLSPDCNSVQPHVLCYVVVQP
ncbi:fibulin-1-like [Macrobrachium rosenbergii]|uniref:fibulin-1-like n=1 Tax=Macrobrachium rosenbergii TaxID=79674 RepID=UPI0034D7834E